MTGFVWARRAAMRGLLGGAVAVISCLTLAAGARADVTITVNGSCTLPMAVAYADGSSESACSSSVPTGTTTIKVPSGGYTLSSTLQITRDTVIDGSENGATVISGNDKVRDIEVGANTQVTISFVTITEGVAPTPRCGATCSPLAGSDGGAILNDGTLTLKASLVTDSAASVGVAGSAGVTLCSLPPTGCPVTVGQDGGSGGNGGGIANFGVLTVTDSSIGGNSAGAGAAGTNGGSGATTTAERGGTGGIGGAGGGIYNASGATATITDSTISANTSGAGGHGGNGSNATQSNSDGGDGGAGADGGYGGGIASFGTLTVTSSTLLANGTGDGGAGGSGGSNTGSGRAGFGGGGGEGGSGGAIAAEGTDSVDTTTLVNDTIATNATGNGGAGILSLGPGQGAGISTMADPAPVTLSFSTVANNANYGSGTPQGSGIDLQGGGTVDESDSIVAGNGSGSQGNCDASVTDGGHNVAYESGAGSGGCPGIVGDPKLAALASNNGGVETMALGAGSAAIGAVPVSACSVTTDARGVKRPEQGVCDAGAYQTAPPSFSEIAVTNAGSVAVFVTNHSEATTVMVRYGTSKTYGSTTATQKVPSTDDPGAYLTFPLSGLHNAKTYHAQILATNSDGTTTSADITFVDGIGFGATTKLLKASTSGTALHLKLGCGIKTTGQACVVRVAVSARAAGSKTVTIARGKLEFVRTKTVTLKLNAAGKRLLAHAHRLRATVLITGTTKITSHVTFTAGHTTKSG